LKRNRNIKVDEKLLNELFHVDDHDPAMARKHVEHEIDSAPLDKLELANLERLGRRKKRRILDGTRINLRRARAGMETLSNMFINRKLYEIKKNKTSIKIRIFQASLIVILGFSLSLLLLWGLVSLVG
jgi:hypothetical protein